MDSSSRLSCDVPQIRSCGGWRERVVALAKEWLNTPYHHMGRIKGVGVDCAMFPLEVYREAGLIPDLDVPFYPEDWHLHRSEEIYLGIVRRFAVEAQSAASPLPGDFVLYHFGRTWSHGAIVLEWPLIIHAVIGRGVILSDGEREGMLVGRARRSFSLW